MSVRPAVSLVPTPTALATYDAARRMVAEAKTVDEVQNIRDLSDQARLYAKQAGDLQMELDAIEIRDRATRQLGFIMQAQEATVGLSKGGRPPGTGGKIPPVNDVLATLAEAGIDKDLAKQARARRKLSDKAYEEKVRQWRTGIETGDRVRVDILKPPAHGTQGTGENEWFTPVEYIDAARDVLGTIDLDPASCAAAQKTVRAKKYFTKENSGLDKEWRGVVWMNPPYATGLIADFVTKLLDEMAADRVTSAIMLTKSYTDTAWFQSAAEQADAICFTKGRIRFVDPDGEPSPAPIQGNAFFYFGNDPLKFAARFHDIGIVYPAAIPNQICKRGVGAA
jgi:phage N-6-adenine-methyltransferase